MGELLRFGPLHRGYGSLPTLRAGASAPLARPPVWYDYPCRGIAFFAADTLYSFVTLTFELLTLGNGRAQRVTWSLISSSPSLKIMHLSVLSYDMKSRISRHWQFVCSYCSYYCRWLRQAVKTSRSLQVSFVSYARLVSGHSSGACWLAQPRRKLQQLTRRVLVHSVTIARKGKFLHIFEISDPHFVYSLCNLYGFILSR